MNEENQFLAIMVVVGACIFFMVCRIIATIDANYEATKQRYQDPRRTLNETTQRAEKETSKWWMLEQARVSELPTNNVITMNKSDIELIEARIKEETLNEFSYKRSTKLICILYDNGVSGSMFESATDAWEAHGRPDKLMIEVLK